MINYWADSDDITLFGGWGPLEKGHKPVTGTMRWVGIVVAAYIRLIVAAPPPARQPEFSGLVYAFFLLLEDQPADLEVQLLGVGEVIDVAQRLILAR